MDLSVLVAKLFLFGSDTSYENMKKQLVKGISPNCSFHFVSLMLKQDYESTAMLYIYHVHRLILVCQHANLC